MTLSRRGLIGAAGGAAAVGAAGLAGGLALGRTAEPPPDPLARTYPFHGAHQAGIATPAQDRLHFAAFDVLTDDRAKLARLLRAWTTAAARLTQGLAAGEQGPTGGSYQAPPDDTGEAIGLPPSGLTLTFGVGPALFDRFGLGQRRPEALTPLPAFPGDALDPDRSDGELCVQACADDPQVAVHAIRNLARIGMGTVSVRWSQLGFGRTSSTSTAQPTPRNMFGFKDGTANLKAEEPDLLDRHVWVPAGRDPREDWLVGGSYLVARRINMTIETWDRTSLAEQERVIGRSKAEGAPLSGGDEFAAPDFAAAGRGGLPLIDPRSHVALAHPDANDGVQLLRRGYNFVDGSTRLGRLDAGLFFLAFVTDPRTHFIPMQTRLASRDALQEYLRHTGSGLWAVLPGVNEGGWLGETLLA
ncbi:iron uptake transporter deferrochelatase/peroxidase subunit [Naumannella huperziae]